MPRHPFYNTATWKRLRALKLKQDPVCEYCLCMAASEVDHAQAISAGGSPTEWKNLRSACHHCHSTKTYYIEVLKRDHVPIKGCNADGTPIDPAHWWNRDTSAQAHGKIVRPGAFKRQPRAITGKRFAVAEHKDRAASLPCTKFRGEDWD